jgi:hypothetical protein
VPNKNVTIALIISQIAERASEFVSIVFYTKCRVRMKINTSAISQSTIAPMMTIQARRRSIDSTF